MSRYALDDVNMGEKK
jgi:hypothetical protein